MQRELAAVEPRQRAGWWVEVLERQAEAHARGRQVELLREQRRIDTRRAHANGFSIREIARFYGCHHSTVSELLRAEASPR